MVKEFDLIEKYFRPLAGPEGLGLVDDAACYRPSEGMDLVITKDVLVENIHFHDHVDPRLLAKKALGVNLSDLAAKAAVPRLYFLGLGVKSELDDNWFEGFAQGLKEMQDAYDCQLAGGDMVASPKSNFISVTFIGEVPHCQMLTRSKACDGDDIWVSGTLGDAAFGLLCIEGKLASNQFLENRYFEPQPRIALGRMLTDLAHSCADISDGLVADLGHIAKASGVDMEIEEALLPLSPAVNGFVEKNAELRQLSYSAGDDYELVFTIEPGNENDLAHISKTTGVKLTKVGKVKKGSGQVQLLDRCGKVVHLKRTGYSHF